MKIIAVIPAHMASVRFPGKILHEIKGLPMIEHVRRRALMCSGLTDVFVATCDDQIAEVIKGFGGAVIKTSNAHNNGTTRVAEAVLNIDCDYVILLQGDEPLLLPKHIDLIIQAIKANPSINVWNATASLEDEAELDRHSFVKCVNSLSGRILMCFRKSPLYGLPETQMKNIRKILGIIAYKKELLVSLPSIGASNLEVLESIEQMRLIENDFSIHSVHVEPSLPSVNEPNEIYPVIEYLENNSDQKKLLSKVLNWF